MAKHARGGQGASVGGPPPVPDQIRPAMGPRHAATPRMGFRRAMAAAVLVVGALAVGGYLVSGGPSANDRNRAATEAPSTPAGRPESGPSAALASPATRPAPGLTRPGILLIASPAPDGSFDMVEQVRLPDPVDALTLRPAAVDRAGHQFASASATATQVQVTAGDRTVVVPGGEVDAAVNLPVTQADHFELRYRLTDVTVRSSPSTPGRALAAIGPLIGGVADDFPVHLIASGGTVLGLNCPLLPLSEQSCGRHVQAGAGFERELPWQLAVATVQFDLPLG